MADDLFLTAPAKKPRDHDTRPHGVSTARGGDPPPSEPQRLSEHVTSSDPAPPPDHFYAPTGPKPRSQDTRPHSPINVTPRARTRVGEKQRLSRERRDRTKPGPAQPATMSFLQTAKGGTEPQTDLRLISYLSNLFIIARDHKRARYDMWLRNYRLVNNKHGAAAQSWMPAPRDSEIYPVISSMVAWMTDQHTTIDFVPAVDPYLSYYSMMAELANDLADIVYSCWLTYNYDSEIKLMLWDAFQYGSGIMKTVWDGSLARGAGDPKFKRVDAWSFYPDPHATNESDMEYSVEVRRMSYDEICRRFGKSKASLLPRGGSGAMAGFDERPTLYTEGTSHSPRANPGNLGGAQSQWGKPTSTSKVYDPLPAHVVYEFWLRVNEYEGSGPTPDEQYDYTEQQTKDSWRVICVCGNVILLDEKAEDLWSYGGHPYDRFAFDDTGEMWGVSLVDHLAYPQIYINRLLTAMQQNAELTGNPILLEAEASGNQRTTVFNRPGQRIPVRGVGGMQMNAPKWLDPPEMSASVMQLVEFWISRIENTAGLSAMTKGITPTQRNAEGVINAVQEAAFVRIRSALTNLEWTLQSGAFKAADLIVDNYTEPRNIAVLGPDGEGMSKALAGRHFSIPGKGGSQPLQFSLQIRAGASTPTSRQSRVAEAHQLFALGAVDDEYVLGVHQIRHAKEILQRLYQKRTSGLIGAPGARQRAGRSS